MCIIMEKADMDLASFVAASVKSRTPVKPVLLLSIMSKVMGGVRCGARGWAR